VLNLRTGSITPQYHVVFDDNKFETVPSKNISDKHIDDKFAELYKSSADFYLDLIDDDDDDDDDDLYDCSRRSSRGSLRGSL
jgi:hypothetical protein